MSKKKQPEPPKLGDFDFLCEKCNTVHHKSTYCIAQQASGHEIVFTCTCGNKFTVPE
jgi:RNase P subunit RPR2